MKDTARVVAIALLVGVLGFWARAVVGSRSSFAAGERAVASQDFDTAVIAYRHAVQWYAPIGTRHRAAFAALVELGDAAADHGSVDQALFAYRSARLGVMATRHLTTPMAGELPALHEKIGTLMAAQTGDPADAERFTAQLDAYRGRRPQPLLGLLASLLFVGWLLSLAGAAWLGFDPEGKLQRGPLVKWGAVSAVLLVGWVACVALA